MRRFCLYSFVLSLVLFGLIACQEKFENESEYSASNRTEFSVTEDVQTKAGTKSTPITGGTGTFKTGESTTITAKGGATISGTRKSGTGSIGATYQQGGLAKADINDIHGDWSVTATIPTYTVNVTATNGGSASGGGTVESGSSTTINCSKPSSGSWDFTGWTSSNGGTFGDKNSQSTTFTPSTDCTVTANFKAAVTTPDYYTLTITVRATAIEVGKSEGLTFTATNVYSGSSVRNVTVSKSGSQTVSYQIKAGQTTTVSVSSKTNNYGRYFSAGFGESVSIKMDSDKSTICYVNY